MDSVKRGLTGDKKNSVDEFFIQKKDPLIIPPDFENLPAPGELSAEKEEISDFEKNLEKDFNLLSNPNFEHYYELANFYKDNEYYKESIKYYSLALKEIKNEDYFHCSI